MATQSRKRGAPSNTPPALQQTSQATGQNSPNMPDLSQLSNDQFLAWGNLNSLPSYAENSALFGGVAGLQEPPYVEPGPLADNNIPSLEHSNSQLVRRNLNRELTVRGRNDTNNELATTQQQQDMWPEHAEGNIINLIEDGDDLTEKAAAAQRDAQSKRPPKQIPPFIQKLSSFLDESRNTDLIRWSDDGNSFIVLDEDRFANELIPELFKHNNYASFVRQLNMYGFHKNVGLSDNSMRASETKAKRPSVYSNPYFKRGRPELLWLIQKPKNETTAAKKRKGKAGEPVGDSDDENKDIPEGPGRMDMTQVSQTAFTGLQREVTQLQRNQHQITAMLARLRDENNQYLRQASAMVAAHERHENSINAILTFLATFYNRSVEGQGNLASMFASANPNNQPQGNVVDMGDLDSTTEQAPNHVQMQMTPSRPPRRLLLAPPAAHSRPSSAAGASSVSRDSTVTPVAQAQQQQNKRASTASTSFNTRHQDTASGHNTSSPGTSPESPQTNAPVHDIMNVINSANASTNNSNNNPTNGNPFDFDATLANYQSADGAAPLTDSQRASVLSMMASHSGTSTPQLNTAGVANPWAEGLEHFQNSRDQIDLLQKMQEEQDWKMQNLADKLQPLSPNGTIPGLTTFPSVGEALGSPTIGRMGPPTNTAQQQHTIPSLKPAPSSDFDINKFLNSDYFPDTEETGNVFDQNFDFDSSMGGMGEQQNGEQSEARAEDDVSAGLFGDGGDDANDGGMPAFLDNAEDQNIHLDGEASGREGGRVLGSVSSSAAGSGFGASPRIKTEDEDEEPTTVPSEARNRKRRRVGE